MIRLLSYFSIVAVLAVVTLVSLLPVTSTEARIRCNGAYQIVRGQGEIATPYCQDNYLAQVARSYGIRVSNAAIRQNPSRKEEVCRAIGHDARVNDLCVQYRNDSCRGRRC